MRTLLWIGMALTIAVGGCSNDSATTGPQVMPVKLNVRVSALFHPPVGATVQVQNLSASTDTSGLAVFHSDINTLIPNHTYKISVIANGLVQAFPDADTIRIPSSPNEPSGYFLQTVVQMIPQ
jgi:hypothetical protein